jgi:rhamnopyranosyl-N-acetylglucosaminyl-diphospho-decaprenol beta-1,3/1,4-galactofuranosyltransferase
MKMTIAAVVVTFNRKELLHENLVALLRQTRLPDKIIIIDNHSTDGTETMLSELGYLQHPLIQYVQLSENTGGAGGFYQGMKTAYEEQYDWFWVMDDDAEPDVDALMYLMDTISSQNTRYLGIIASTVMYPDRKICYNHRRKFDCNKLKYSLNDKDVYKQDYFELDLISFVGAMINRNLVEEIGFPIKDYFIYYDDTEYSLRARENGWKIMNASRSIVVHKAKDREGRAIHAEFARAFYWSRRNMIYTYKNHGESRWWITIRIVTVTIRNIITITLFRKNKLSSAKILWFATIDGLIGNFKRAI